MVGLYPVGSVSRGLCIQWSLHPFGSGISPQTRDTSDTKRYDKQVRGTHPTGMHSCSPSTPSTIWHRSLSLLICLVINQFINCQQTNEKIIIDINDRWYVLIFYN